MGLPLAKLQAEPARCLFLQESQFSQLVTLDGVHRSALRQNKKAERTAQSPTVAEK